MILLCSIAFIHSIKLSIFIRLYFLLKHISNFPIYQLINGITILIDKTKDTIYNTYFICVTFSFVAFFNYPPNKFLSNVTILHLSLNISFILFSFSFKV